MVQCRTVSESKIINQHLTEVVSQLLRDIKVVDYLALSRISAGSVCNPRKGGGRGEDRETDKCRGLKNSSMGSSRRLEITVTELQKIQGGMYRSNNITIQSKIPANYDRHFKQIFFKRKYTHFS